MSRWTTRNAENSMASQVREAGNEECGKVFRVNRIATLHLDVEYADFYIPAQGYLRDGLSLIKC